MRRRVKITGIGPVTPAGIGRDAFFRGINEPVSRVKAITRFDPVGGPFVGAELLDFDLRRYAPDENPRRLSRHTQLGLVAAMLALDDAGLDAVDLGRLNPVIVTGTSIMDVDKIGKGIETVIKRGTRYSQAASIIYETSTVNIAAKIAQRLQVPTRMLTVQTSCCSGLDAIGQAMELIANGQSDLAIAGGSECPLVYYPMLGFNASELSPTSDTMPEKACRPFDLWRSTGALGEGASIFVLEPEDSPRRPMAWISGHGFANDPDGNAGSGLHDALHLALANASRRPEEVEYINAWGPGHRRIDPTEASALRRMFGSRLAEIPVSSIKGAVGTALGASGPIQLASVVLSLEHGLLPPTVNWETPDPDCALNLANHSRRVAINLAVINAHGLSGSNSALVIER
jgi:3-oxoacyl-(acyl-carrier-protein) synthase